MERELSMGLIREIFGATEGDIWSQLSQEIGADYEEGGFFKEEKVVLSHQPWEPEHLVSRLLSNGAIRQLIQSLPNIHFQVKDDEGWFKKNFPEGVDELYFEVVGVIKDKERLKSLFDLFSLVLDELCRLGSAYEDEPKVTLG